MQYTNRDYTTTMLQNCDAKWIYVVLITYPITSKMCCKSTSIKKAVKRLML